MSPQVELAPLKPIAESYIVLAVEPRWSVADFEGVFRCVLLSITRQLSWFLVLIA